MDRFFSDQKDFTMKRTALVITSLLVGACAAKPMIAGAERVILSNEAPANDCRFIAEVTGGQGNWWTDDITSSKNIIQGSRNDLRNEAFELGANFVQIQQSSGSQTYLGGTTMGLAGNAYSCSSQPLVKQGR